MLERLEYAQDKEHQLPLIIPSFLEHVRRELIPRVQKTISKVEKKFAHLLEELGLWAAWTFLEELVQALQNKFDQDASNNVTSSRRSKEIVLKCLRPLADRLAEAHAAYAQTHHGQIHLSSKAQCFMRHLNHVIECRQDEIMGIVFVRQRVVTVMLEKLLAYHPGVTNKIRPRAYVGESNSVSYEKELSELVVPRTQSDTLQEFRLGKSNLIISTDALDEGIDVAECNTIICFESPQNLRSFIQKRGRARKKESTYTIMVPEGGSKMSPDTFEEMEAVMSQIIRQEEQEVREANKEAVEESVDFCLQSDKTA